MLVSISVLHSKQSQCSGLFFFDLYDNMALYKAEYYQNEA
jgi:hypothetical protein